MSVFVLRTKAYVSCSGPLAICLWRLLTRQSRWMTGCGIEAVCAKQVINERNNVCTSWPHFWRASPRTRKLDKSLAPSLFVVRVCVYENMVGVFSDWTEIYIVSVSLSLFLSLPCSSSGLCVEQGRSVQCYKLTKTAMPFLTMLLRAMRWRCSNCTSLVCVLTSGHVELTKLLYSLNSFKFLPHFYKPSQIRTASQR